MLVINDCINDLTRNDNKDGKTKEEILDNPHEGDSFWIPQYSFFDPIGIEGLSMLLNPS